MSRRIRQIVHIDDPRQGAHGEHTRRDDDRPPGEPPLRTVLLTHEATDAPVEQVTAEKRDNREW